MRDTIFRLFLSSTFSDFQHERRALHKRVFPVLDEHARAHGARFEVVDLRWGISREAQDNNHTLSICLGEIARCQRIGLPPNFAVLLGDRYGWQPPPVEITGAVWLQIMSAAGSDIQLLNAHYAPDKNSMPVVWRLKTHTFSRPGSDERTALVSAVRRAAIAAKLSPLDHPEIFFSATHQEILKGALSLPVGTADVFAYVREIKGLPLSVAGAPYVDTTGDAWDETAHLRLEAMKQHLSAHLAPGNLRRTTTHWDDGGIATDHLEQFCEQFLSDQIGLINRALAAEDHTHATSNVNEAHRRFAEDRASLFVGRAAEVSRITNYARTYCAASDVEGVRSPLIIIGEGGTGKSALLAECARRLESKNEQSIVVTRFIGAVPGSESLASLLSELAQTISTAYGQTSDASATNFDAASHSFLHVLNFATTERPLVLVIDALDQLAASDQLYLLDWLPDSLPAAVCLVLTTRDGPIATEARRRFSTSLIHLSSMDKNDSMTMLDRLLADAERRITPAQRNEIERASPGLPLWTRLAFEEARLWHSDDISRTLETTVEGLILARITDLSDAAAHGPALTRDTLAAIAASRFGLSDSEISEVLSDDSAPEVWTEFRARSFHDWDERHLPPILWFRLHEDIAPYLAEQRIDGTLTYRFFHREFQEVVARQFLDGSHKSAIHRRLATVFANAAERGFHGTCDVTKAQEPRSLRRIMEQPWQLAAAGEYAALAKLINDVGFVAGKCAANRVADLMQDIASLVHGVSFGQVAHASADWHARLLAWRPMLEQGDSHWPAHRILFQLLLEADDTLVQRGQALNILQQHPPDWRVLVNSARQQYTPPLMDMVAAPDGMAGMAQISSRIIAVWDQAGSLRLIDRITGAIRERLELGNLNRIADFLSSVASTLSLSTIPTPFYAPDPNDRRRAVTHTVNQPALKLSWQWGGCLVVENQISRTEIIIGKEDITFLGETTDALFFLIDNRIAIADKQHLAELSGGLLSFNGQRISGMEIDGDADGWTHERFNSVVFIDADTCLTFGFSLGGTQRDDVILEIYRITLKSVQRYAYGITDHDLDLPIWHVVGLSNGSIVFASERYWHTFEWSPPFDGECDVTMIPGAAVGRGAIGNWIDVGSPDGHLAFEPADPAIHVIFNAPGFYGSWSGEYYTPDGITNLDPDDFAYTTTEFNGIEIEDDHGRIARWHSDVRPHWIFEREGRDFIVFKNSGPVRIMDWNKETQRR